MNCPAANRTEETGCKEANKGHLPNFLIIGAGKSGTTSLYHYLMQHPQVFMSPVKEPNFFALEGQKLIPGAKDPQQLFHYPWAVTELDAYRNLFKGARNEKAKGEASTMYLYNPAAPGRIKHYIPQVRMVAIFRDPVERLYSRYMHLTRENRQPTSNFANTLNKKSIWWRRNDLVKEGFYHTHLKRYFDHFSRNQIKVFLYDDLRSNPKKLLADLYRFLQVDVSFAPEVSIRYNQSGRIKNRFVERLIGQNNIVRKHCPRLADRTKSSLFLQRFVMNMRKRNLDKPPLELELRAHLIKDIYQEEIFKFQNLIQRDLSKWLH